MDILQWNLNSFFSHLPELQKIVSEINPSFVYLQETKLKTKHNAKLTNYSCFRCDRNNDGHASGGVAIFIKNNIQAEELNVNTNLETIAITTVTPQKLTICNIYIPPDTPRQDIDLENIISQLPKPFLFLGDFNAHNQIWGSRNIDSRGKYIERITEDELIILNESSPRHFCTRTGKFSSIDLAISDPTLSHKIDWKTLPHLYGSDHI